MIKLFANACRAFNQGEKDKHGALKRVIAKPGFNEMPDWVEKDPYYALCVKDGSIKPFVSAAESREIEKGAQKLSSLQEDIAELEAKKNELKKDIKAMEKEKAEKKDPGLDGKKGQEGDDGKEGNDKEKEKSAA